MNTTNTNISLEPTYLRKKEAIEFLGLCHTFFYELIKTGKIKRYKLGKKIVYFKVSELKEFLNKETKFEPYSIIEDEMIDE